MTQCKKKSRVYHYVGISSFLRKSLPYTNSIQICQQFLLSNYRRAESVVSCEPYTMYFLKYTAEGMIKYAVTLDNESWLPSDLLTSITLRSVGEECMYGEKLSKNKFFQINPTKFISDCESVCPIVLYTYFYRTEIYSMTLP